MAGVTSFISNLCMDCFSCCTSEKTRTITLYIAAHGEQKTEEEDIIPNTGAKLLSFCGKPGELGWMEQPEDLGEYSVDENAIDESYRIFKSLAVNKNIFNYLKIELIYKIIKTLSYKKAAK